MGFREKEIDDLDLSNSPQNIARLIVRFLCGKNYDPKISREDKVLMNEFISSIGERELSYRQLNELLLLLNQDTISRDFFTLFFGTNVKTLDDLKKGIIKFRGVAMLYFGNFKFAYRQLSQMSEEQMVKRFAHCFRNPLDIIRKLRKRPKRLLQIREIARGNTWYLGEITGGKVNADIENAVRIAEKEKSLYSDFAKFMKRLEKMDKQITVTQRIGLLNTDVYLTWDYMDIYVATSMRNIWEYEETYDFLKRVFENNCLKGLNIRYFDPTQSACTNPRDKGLIEGLMLKRSACAIYLAQESDTMGKDSELAATLAQGKPVIAYVPKHNPIVYSKQVAKHPLNFFKRRLSILDAEEIYEYPECKSKLKQYDKDFEKTIAGFLEELADYRSEQPFSLWREKEEEFKKGSKFFRRICRIVALAECFNFDRRADLLRSRHPLCIQVDLQTGVANGVLVVRSAEECANLLFRILTNQMKFVIKHIIPGIEAGEKRGYTILEEEISGCGFRVITDYERLTNSFWNLFETRRNNLYTL